MALQRAGGAKCALRHATSSSQHASRGISPLGGAVPAGARHTAWDPRSAALEHGAAAAPAGGAAAARRDRERVT